MTAEYFVARAKRAIGHGCIYHLGRGGMRGDAVWPWTVDSECDCSGFLAWALAISRKTDNPWYTEQNGGWLETTAIARDCTTPFGLFDPVFWNDACPGHILVYGDSGTGQGHVGIISAVDKDGPSSVVHCSSGNYKKFGDAIRETDAGLFKRKNALVARCALITRHMPEIPGKTFTPEP